MKKKKVNDFNNNWLIFVDIKNKKGVKFEDVTSGKKSNKKIIGSWANVIIKADDVFLALEILKKGLKELNFEIKHVDSVENVQTLFDKKEINPLLINEINWLNNSEFVFKIYDKIFNYNKI